MDITGEMLIGGAAIRGSEAPFHGVDPATGDDLAPAFGGAGKQEVERACTLAWEAFDAFRETSLEARARLLETIAAHIMDIGDALIERATAETGLPRGRIEGERARTVGQLRLFAEVVREGSFLEARIDPAMPDRKPLPRSDLRMRMVAVGPVAVFGASNFPLAFSVAGGDTASALAAGCPVVVKAHPAHPGTSELVGRAVRDAVTACGMPDGVFSLLFGAGNALGGALVADPRIKSVGFTGSRRGGVALMRIAADRPEPIPVHAEMSSINPVLILPAALAARGAAIGKALVGSMTLGAGQFCTNPGLVFAVDGPGLDALRDAAASAVSDSAAQTMLTPGMHGAYRRGVERLSGHSGLKTLARGKPGREGGYQGQAQLFTTDAATFASDPELQEEVFGASSILIRCPDVAAMREQVERLEGQLTVTLQMDEDDHAQARILLPTLERKAGRVLVNGFPTGVEVAHAMVHGGPYPATSDGRTTSVGTLAIRRFLRPVCYQDFPPALLPELLRDGNPLGTWRRIDGKLGRE